MRIRCYAFRMLRHSTNASLPKDAPEHVKPLSHEEIMEERMDQIVHYLHRMDRRERWRSVGGGIHALIAFIPTVLFLGSIVYFYYYGDDLIEEMMNRAVRQVTFQSSAPDDGGNIFEQFRSFFGGDEEGASSSLRGL